jgi:hypothetical protein
MPAIVHFVGAEKTVTLEEDYDKVIAAFKGREVGLFGEGAGRVAIYKAGVAYVEDASDTRSL